MIRRVAFGKAVVAGAANRRALHLAEVIQMSLRDGVPDEAGEYAETKYFALRRPKSALTKRETTILAAGAVCTAVGLWWTIRQLREWGDYSESKTT